MTGHSPVQKVQADPLPEVEQGYVILGPISPLSTSPRVTSMPFSIRAALRIFSAGVLSLTATAVVFAQRPTSDETDVIRISTELVQTGVVVLDKQGRFVEGLKPDQFLLRVDGKPVTPAFFEHVIAGTVNEQRLEAAVARGASATPAPT